MNATLAELSHKCAMLWFSKSWRDPVLWAHYDDLHRGICPGFEVRQEKRQEVEYVQERLAVPSNHKGGRYTDCQGVPLHKICELGIRKRNPHFTDLMTEDQDSISRISANLCS